MVKQGEVEQKEVEQEEVEQTSSTPLKDTPSHQVHYRVLEYNNVYISIIQSVNEVSLSPGILKLIQTRVTELEIQIKKVDNSDIYKLSLYCFF